MALATRAVSPVVRTVLLLGVTVLLAAGIATGVAVDAMDLSAPSAVVEGEAPIAGCTGCDPADQVLRLRHAAGDSLHVDELALVVAIPDADARGRIVDLPLSNTCLNDAHVEGVDVFDGRCRRTTGSIVANGVDADATWQVGDRVTVQIARGAVALSPDDRIRIRVVHAPSGAVAARTTLTAVENESG